ncbi:MAG: hypothetical protein LHV68_07805 [Elusimicrobia bacterium]|nr:hypothetical protein [Candidatus Liberimonas magnetica]
MVSENKDTLVDFSSIEKNLEHVNLVNLNVRPIPIENILGSLGRYQDFTEGFIPQSGHTSPKYESVKMAMLAGKILPPIKVYKILDNYFVIDGHHRVTIAKNEIHAIDIDAEVIEVRFDFELSPEKKYTYNTGQARDFLILLEEDVFQKRTHLKNVILKYPLKVTELTSYGKIYEEIYDFKQNYNNKEFARKDIIHASFIWYEKRFLPAVQIILDEGVLEDFKSRTYTDLYVWIQQHKYYLSQKVGYDVGFDFTMDDFVSKFKKAKFLDLIPQMMKDIVGIIKKEIKKIQPGQ